MSAAITILFFGGLAAVFVPLAIHQIVKDAIRGLDQRRRLAALARERAVPQRLYPTSRHQDMPRQLPTTEKGRKR